MDTTEATLPPAPRFVSAEELAKIIGVSVRTIRRWTRERLISCLRAGASAPRYDVSVVTSELNQEKQA